MIKKLLIVLVVILILWHCLPIYTVGAARIGIIAPITYLIVVLALLLTWGTPISQDSEGRIKFIFKGIAAFCALVFVAFAAVSAFMLNAAYKSAGKNASNSTVIVLGCKINADVPSLMLSRRLEAARKYLDEYPGAMCIVSGGQGPDELYTEAEIMKKYLTDRGIPENRILEEGRSTSTEENLKYSKEIIDSMNLSYNVAIATDEFHQLRAGIIAQREGLSSVPATSKTPWYLITYYWSREIFALANTYVNLV